MGYGQVWSLGVYCLESGGGGGGGEMPGWEWWLLDIDTYKMKKKASYKYYY